METCEQHTLHSNSADGDQRSPEINSTFASSLFFLPFRRRREKLQAHLKESRSLKNYTANSHDALDAKMRAPNINLQMHEVATAVFTFAAWLSFSVAALICLDDDSNLSIVQET